MCVCPSRVHIIIYLSIFNSRIFGHLFVGRFQYMTQFGKRCAGLYLYHYFLYVERFHTGDARLIGTAHTIAELRRQKLRVCVGKMLQHRCVGMLQVYVYYAGEWRIQIRLALLDFVIVEIEI